MYCVVWDRARQEWCLLGWRLALLVPKWLVFLFRFSLWPQQSPCQQATLRKCWPHTAVGGDLQDGQGISPPHLPSYARLSFSVGTEPRASGILGKCSTTKLHPQLFKSSWKTWENTLTAPQKEPRITIQVNTLLYLEEYAPKDWNQDLDTWMPMLTPAQSWKQVAMNGRISWIMNICNVAYTSILACQCVGLDFTTFQLLHSIWFSKLFF